MKHVGKSIATIGTTMMIIYCVVNYYFTSNSVTIVFVCVPFRSCQQLSTAAVLLPGQAVLLPGFCAGNSGGIPAHRQNCLLHVDWYGADGQSC